MTKVLRELNKGELTLKDMSVLREQENVRTQYRKNAGDLKEYSLNHTVRMSWQNNADRDLRPFTLLIDRQPYKLSWGELKDAEAAGFFRRESDQRYYKMRFYDGHKITIDTDLNDEAQRDYIFRLTAKGVEAYLDWYEMLRLGRLI